MAELVRLWKCTPGGFVLAPERLLARVAAHYGVNVERPATDKELTDATTWFGPSIHVRYMKLRLSIAAQDAAYQSLKADASAEPDKARSEEKILAADDRADRLIRISRGEEP